MQAERRFFDRRPLRLPLIVSLKQDDTVVEAETRDLGAKGLGISSKDRIPSEGEINLRVEIPGKNDFLNLVGNLIWAREYFPDGWRAGVGLKEQSVNLVAFSVLQDMINLTS